MNSTDKEMTLAKEDSEVFAEALIEPIKLTALDRCLIEAFARYKERVAKQDQKDTEQINEMLLCGEK